jgi:hypothetical protein
MVNIIARPTITFLSEWLTSTVDLVFRPASIGENNGRARRRKAESPGKNLAFAASSIAFAFIIYQADSTEWSAKTGGSFALLYLSVICIYAIINAAILKILSGSQTPVNNVLIGIRVLAIFYVLAIVGASFCYLMSNNNARMFHAAFVISSALLYAVYFPIIFCKLNQLKLPSATAFVILCTLFVIGRSVVSDAAAGHPLSALLTAASRPATVAGRGRPEQVPRSAQMSPYARLSSPNSTRSQGPEELYTPGSYPLSNTPQFPYSGQPQYPAGPSPYSGQSPFSSPPQFSGGSQFFGQPSATNGSQLPRHPPVPLAHPFGGHGVRR